MLKSFFLILSLVLFSFFIGCSSLVESTKRSLFGDKNKSERQSKWVSKSKYDELLAKYKNLEEENKKLNSSGISSPSKFDQISELSNSTSKPESVETVDLFAEDGKIVTETSSGASPALNIKEKSEEQVNDELGLYSKAMALYDNGKLGESLSVFQHLEREGTLQVKVRAQLYIGKIYMKQNQFDLALQVFESIITGGAYSGRVLEALSHSVTCATKLGLEDKKVKYQSLLVDVFGV